MRRRFNLPGTRIAAKDTEHGKAFLIGRLQSLDTHAENSLQ